MDFSNKFLKKKSLLNGSKISYLDPFLFYSAYSILRYIESGNELKIWSIDFYNMGFIPSLKMGLTPFGPEYFFENYVKFKNRPFYFYVKAGQHSDNYYLGTGAWVPKFYQWDTWSLGWKIDIWRQPTLLLNQGNIPTLAIDFDEEPDPEDPIYSYEEQSRKSNGMAASLTLARSGKTGIEAEVGCKTQGYLPGYNLTFAPIFRLYLSSSF